MAIGGKMALPTMGHGPAHPEPPREPVVIPADAPLPERVVAVLKTVYDPEIPVDIYELGLIYDLAVSEENAVHVKMTLTSPACPVAGSLPKTVQERIEELTDVNGVKVDLVWDPPWEQSRMSEAARLALGFF